MIHNILIIRIDGRIAFHQQYWPVDITPNIRQELLNTLTPHSQHRRLFEQELGLQVDLPIYVNNIKFLAIPLRKNLFLVFGVDILDEDNKIKDQLHKARDLLINKYGHEIDTYIQNPLPAGEAFQGFAKELDTVIVTKPKICLLGQVGVGKSTMLKLLTEGFVAFHLGGGPYYPELLPRIVVWDFYGQDRFRSLPNYMLQNYILGNADAVLLVTDSTLKNVLETRDILEIIRKNDPSAIVWAIANKQDLPGALSSRDIALILGIPAFSMVAFDYTHLRRMREIVNNAISGTLPEPDKAPVSQRLSASKERALKKILQSDSPIRKTYQKVFSSLKEAQLLLQSGKHDKTVFNQIKMASKPTKKLVKKLLQAYQKIFRHPKYLPQLPDKEKLQDILWTAAGWTETRNDTRSSELTDDEKLVFSDSDIYITYLKDLLQQVELNCDKAKSILDTNGYIHEINSYFRSAVNYANYLKISLEVEPVTPLEKPIDYERIRPDDQISFPPFFEKIDDSIRIRQDVKRLRVECWNCSVIVTPDSWGSCPNCGAQFPRFVINIRILPDTTPELEQRRPADPIKLKEAELAADYYKWLLEEIIIEEAIQPSDYTLPQDRPAVGPRTIQSCVPEEERRFDAVYKVVMLGDPATGKEELINKYVSGKFERDYRRTLGIDISTFDAHIDDRLYKLLLWDLAGEDIFVDLRKIYCQGASGGMIFFDLTRPSTLESVPEWVKAFQAAVGPEHPIVLIGTNAELKQSRKIPKETALKMATKLGIVRYFEVSTRTGQNIPQAFNTLTQQMYNQITEKKPQKTHNKVSEKKENKGGQSLPNGKSDNRSSDG